MSDWAKLKVVDLKAELKRRGLPQHGLKNDLIARLEEADQGMGQMGEKHIDEAVAQSEDHDMTEPTAPEADPKPESESSSPQELAAQETALATAEVEDPEPQANKIAENEDATKAHGIPLDNDAVMTSPIAKEQQDIVLEAETMEVEQQLPTPKDILSSGSPHIREQLLANSEELEGEESAKRKRRSQSPPPNEENARKRARADDGSAAIAPDVVMELEENQEKAMHGEGISKDAPTTKQLSEDVSNEDQSSMPSVHPPTSALYVSNLMRPLRPDEMKMHLVNLATTPNTSPEEDAITLFFLDQVRTHCFAVFTSTSAASRVRQQLHTVIWPNESNRKPLWVDFVPPEEVPGWVEKEESATRAGPRYEVVYRDNADGSVSASLDIVTPTAPSGRPPTGPSNPSSSGRRPVPAEGANTIPVGPRAFRDLQPPTGPRPKPSGPGPRPPPIVGGPMHRTRSGPPIEYRLVDEELARRRLASIRAHYASDAPRRNPGDDLNRYSFENGDGFVDRGKEVFEGIRPPHRERARQGDRRGGGLGFRRGGRGWRGGRDAKQRGDRYLPRSSYSGRDDGRPPRNGRDSR